VNRIRWSHFVLGACVAVACSGGTEDDAHDDGAAGASVAGSSSGHAASGERGLGGAAGSDGTGGGGAIIDSGGAGPADGGDAHGGAPGAPEPDGGSTTAGAAQGGAPSNADDGGSPGLGGEGVRTDGGSDATGTTGGSAGSGAETDGSAAAAGGLAGSSGEGGGPACSRHCVPTDEACESHGQCPQTQYCDGYCRPAARIQEPCSPDDRCGEGLYCNASQVCAARIGLMQPYPGPGAPCVLGTFCAQAYAEPQYRCRAPAGVGEECQGELWPRPPCQNGLFCMGPNPAYEYVCEAAKLEGESCLTGVCAEGTYCDDLAWPSLFCVRSPGRDEPCLPASACFPRFLSDYTLGCSPCATGLYCDENGVCREPIAQGQDCAAIRCQSGLACVAATPEFCE